MNTPPKDLRHRYGAIMTLAWPIVAASASQNLMNLVDTVMIGKLGAVELAAVGMASIALWVMTGVLQGMGSAVQAMTARRLGESKQTRLHEGMVHAIFFIVLASVPYTFGLLGISEPLFQLLISDEAVQTAGVAYLDIRLLTIPLIGLNFAFRGYFNGLRKPKIYMATLLVMHPLNMLLNYLLIFGKWGCPALGVQGAAIGTAVATSLGCLVFISLMLQQRTPDFSMHWKHFSKRIMATLARLSWPASLQAVTLAGGYLLFYRIAGMVSTEALAGVNILVNLTLVCILIAMGIGLATLTLVGNALGRQDEDEARSWVKSGVMLTSIFVGIIGLLFALFPKFWLTLFIDDPLVVQAALIPMIIMGLSQVYDGAAIVLMHAHLGGGASKTVMAISFINQWVIFLPACFAMVYFFDAQLVHLYVGMAVYRFLLFLSFYLSIKKDHWLQITV